MDKPVSLSVKHWIIRQMSVRTMRQESIIETVVNHQFENAYIAIDNCNSLEFSGFGRFYFNVKKAHKKLEKLTGLMEHWNKLVNDSSTEETKRKMAEYKLKIIIKEFEYLKTKLGNENTMG